MSKQAIMNPLSLSVGALLLMSVAGVRPAAAAGPDVDPQAQAAHLLQHPVVWISGAEGVQLTGHGRGQVLDQQAQARRVLQPVVDVADGGSAVFVQFLASETLEPQSQAARLLSRNFY